MQDNWQEFDLLVKSQLEDAEVKAPRRSWRAICSRIDEAAALSALSGSERPGRRRLGYAAAALAFAACLCAGLFFAGTFDSKSPAPSQATLAQTLVPESVPVDILPVAGPQEPEPETVTASSRKRQDRASVAEPAIAETSVPDVVEPAAEEASRTPGKGSDASTKQAEDEAAIQASIDYWANIDAVEKTRRSHRPALYAQGSIGGNDSQIGAGTFGRMAPSMTSQKDIGITESSGSVYGVPFSIGIGARFYLSDRFSLGTGIDYSILTRTFSGSYSPDGIKSYDGDISGRMRYLGIPLNAYYDVFRAGKSVENSVKFYVYGGGAAEYCISNSYSILSAPERTVVSDPVKGLQWSVGGGIGVEFRISEHLGIYLDPGFRYYFNCGQPKSVRTDKPLMVNFEAGLRFNL